MPDLIAIIEANEKELAKVRLERNLAESAVELLRAACEKALGHVLELEEAWRTGALSERDGKGGERSNRNVDVRVSLESVISATKRTPE